MDAFREELDRLGLYVFTINGFPYGAFHGRPVKEKVYRPDWLEDERLVYADTLATVLAGLMAGRTAGEGSVSTVPGCFLGRASGDAPAAVARNVLRHAAHLWRIREDTGLTVGLALEPEPHCLLETTADAAAFFERHLFAPDAVAAFADGTGLSLAGAEEALRRHVGVCLDACHAAVQFEEPADAVRRLQAAGIRILKIQVSAGLRLQEPDGAALAALKSFAEPVYLHQVVVREGERLRRYLDLPEAIAAARAESPGDEWRVHFHVPLFQDALGSFQSTQPFVAELLQLQARASVTNHLEVETYTWDVLPEEHRRVPVVDAVARELAWTLGHLGRAGQ
jgi:sugar phosphate isomerase/epimerase